MTRIALIPLDERPVNTRYPEMLAAIGGAKVLLPPAEFRGSQRELAQRGQIANWVSGLIDKSAVDAIIVSCELFGYGNLINSRVSEESAATIIRQLSTLQVYNRSVPVHAFSLITRVSNADDAVEEPRYWREWGTKLYAYSRLAHRHEDRHQSGDLTQDERAQLVAYRTSVPPELAADWLGRRLRNHAVNLTLMDMAARGRIASLLLTSDDTAPFGFPSRERNWLRAWLEMVGTDASANIRMHPGADEVGSALATRLINQAAGTQPRVWTEYAVPEGEEMVAPYEDRPARETVLGQIESCGCVPAESPDECDFVLGVATPSPRRADYDPAFLDQDRVEREEFYRSFLARLAGHQAAGRPVALADIAYPNGADPLLAELLLGGTWIRPATLAAYSAWNTAGNTLGTTVAQAACSLLIGDDPTQDKAQCVFLTHRFLEDFGYQTVVRREARNWAEARWGRRDPDPESPTEVAATTGFVEGRLREVLAQLQAAGVGRGLKLRPGSVRLPWRRLFEADFELTDAAGLFVSALADPPSLQRI